MTRTAPARVPLSAPRLTGNELAYLEECVRSGFVSSVGPFVERFESAFAAWIGARHAVACSSGTAALHLAMRLGGVSRDDEVLVPSFTFVASINAALYEGATPVLVDSERLTWNMDPDLVVGELRRRARAGARQPKAVEVVHILGHPARIDELAAACEEHGVLLVEDAAEALGARYARGRYEGRHVGTIGRMGCFSFNGNKVITAGGGGMITTDDARLAERARHLSRQARLPGRSYRHDEVGYNYRMTNIAAAVGLAQLEQLDRFLDEKRRIARRYSALLAEVPGITRPPDEPWASPSHWLYSFLLDARGTGTDPEGLCAALDAEGFEARPVWGPAHALEPYADLPRLGTGEVAVDISSRGVSLPSSVGLTAQQQRAITDVVIATVGSVPDP